MAGVVLFYLYVHPEVLDAPVWLVPSCRGGAVGATMKTTLDENSIVIVAGANNALTAAEVCATIFEATGTLRGTERAPIICCIGRGLCRHDW